MRLEIRQGDALSCLKEIDSESVDCVITSPPYWGGLRDYKEDAQLGWEPTLDQYISKIINITNELKRVLKPTGTMFWNHGDCYKNKCFSLQNYQIALRMVEQGWLLRNILVWHKPNHMPSSVKDRFTPSYEPIFFFVKTPTYYFDLDSIRLPHKTDFRKFKLKDEMRSKTLINPNETGARLPPEPGEPNAFHSLGKNPGDILTKHDEAVNRTNRSYLDSLHEKAYSEAGKNPGDYFQISTTPCPDAHFAVFPEGLVKPFIDVGCPKEGLVLDPFAGSGTVLKVSKDLGRNAIGIELNKDYCDIIRKRVGFPQNSNVIEFNLWSVVHPPKDDAEPVSTGRG